MSISNDIRGLLKRSGKKQLELAELFDMSPQTMSNKMRRESWSANELMQVAAFCGYELSFTRPDGQKIIIGKE